MSVPRAQDLQGLFLSVGGIRVSVKRAGDGPPLLYFHNAWGFQWDPFLQGLAQRYTLWAPELPGTGDSDPHDIFQVDSLWDLVVLLGDVVDALGVKGAALVGHSFGGMLAAEVAAHWPDRFRRLVLLAPLGLWRTDLPITNWMALPPHQLPHPPFLVHDPSAPAVQAHLAALQEGDTSLARARRIWALGCSAKFWWPIPDRGLRKRLHRVRLPTLVIWGREDKVIPVGYAQEFVQALPQARALIVEGAGHLPHLERLDTVLPAVVDFLGGGDGGP
jgi:pimeloyl-ACP methyl ester carboxylesterase